MPTYEYRCANCGHELEAVQSFSDAALTQCPQCGEAALRKLFGNVGVVFKGSGFYRNDSRNDPKGGAKTAAAASSKSSESKNTSDGAATSDSSSSSDSSKPATPASATPTSTSGKAAPTKGKPAKGKSD